jgi:myo-inositol-1(or 4)-monophosphatase
MSHSDLLGFAKSVALGAANEVDLNNRHNLTNKISVEMSGREFKLSADLLLNEYICKELTKTSIAILSEESLFGYKKYSNMNLLWIVDPLDGSYNFMRGHGPSAISIALWGSGKPIFGVIYDFESERLSWGGKEFGSWTDVEPNLILSKSEVSNSLVFTGFPVRFNGLSAEEKYAYLELLQKFNKVRMIGSAACSLLKVAQGKGEAYLEKMIMIWDVAAGIAIVEGAGGYWNLTKNALTEPCSLIAGNKHAVELANW